MRALPLLLSLVLVSSSSGCGPIIETAPFHARPDTVLEGNLLGPYDGRVLEGNSERAVADATVYATWTFERGIGFVGPNGAADYTTKTDAAGTYRIPALSDLPGGLSTRVSELTLIIYKAGFIGYRSDRLYPSGARRTDFAQHGNVVRLERMGANLSHARHLAFIGGAPPLRGATAWESELASLELLEPRAAKQTAAPLLNAWPLLTVADVRIFTGYQGTFEEQRIPDLPRTSSYDSHHFRAVGQAERFDVALRLWQLDPGAAQEQFDKLKSALPSVKPAESLGAQAITAETEEILAFIWVDPPRGVVAQLTCGKAQCPTVARALAMAKLVEQRAAQRASEEKKRQAPPAPGGSR